MKHVLVVDDEPAVATLVQIVLEQGGYKVTVSGDPRKALEVDAGYDLALLDVLMPGMDGAELAVRLCEKQPTLRVLFMSGYTGNVNMPEGAVVLNKPFRLDTLLEAVQKALGRQ